MKKKIIIINNKQWTMKKRKEKKRTEKKNRNSSRMQHPLMEKEKFRERNPRKPQKQNGKKELIKKRKEKITAKNEGCCRIKMDTVQRCQEQFSGIIGYPGKVN